jgi:hypothetical protein
MCHANAPRGGRIKEVGVVVSGFTGASNCAPTTDTAVAGKLRSFTRAVVMSLAEAVGERGRVMALEVDNVKVPPKCAGGCSWERFTCSVGGSKGKEASQALDAVAFTTISEGPGYPSVSRVILQAKER